MAAVSCFGQPTLPSTMQIHASLCGAEERGRLASGANPPIENSTPEADVLLFFREFSGGSAETNEGEISVLAAANAAPEEACGRRRRLLVLREAHLAYAKPNLLTRNPFWASRSSPGSETPYSGSRQARQTRTPWWPHIDRAMCWAATHRDC